MKQKKVGLIAFMILIAQLCIAQEIIPLDTTNWEFSEGSSYILEKYKGKNALYIKGGNITARNILFENGTIEFDVYLKNEQAFPGVSFRAVDNDAELFYIRAHLSGKPDANQVIPVTNGISPWQMYFGSKYSFPHEYKYDDWTHVRIDVHDSRAQVYLDHSETPQLSWNLFHPARAGKVILRAGMRSGMHIADIKISKTIPQLKDFAPGERAPIEGIIPEWEISDKFERSILDDPNQLKAAIDQRRWGRKIKVEEGIAANISRQQLLRDNQPGETVFARINIRSDKDQTKLFQFGYSDDVLAVLNGKAIYRGTNRYRSRDYRYLGTVGLFDGIYLDLKKGDNSLLMAVSENFGGWLITGKFENNEGITVN